MKKGFIIHYTLFLTLFLSLIVGFFSVYLTTNNKKMIIKTTSLRQQRTLMEEAYHLYNNDKTKVQILVSTNELIIIKYEDIKYYIYDDKQCLLIRKE